MQNRFCSLKQCSDMECAPCVHHVYTFQDKGWHGHCLELFQCPPGAHPMSEHCFRIIWMWFQAVCSFLSDPVHRNAKGVPSYKPQEDMYDDILDLKKVSLNFNQVNDFGTQLSFRGLWVQMSFMSGNLVLQENN